MIRIHRPGAVPRNLEKKGKERTAKDCADYDADPEVYHSGEKKFCITLKIRCELVLFNGEIFFIHFFFKRCLTTLITESVGFGGFFGASTCFRRIFSDFWDF